MNKLPPFSSFFFLLLPSWVPVSREIYYFILLVVVVLSLPNARSTQVKHYKHAAARPSHLISR